MSDITISMVKHGHSRRRRSPPIDDAAARIPVQHNIRLDHGNHDIGNNNNNIHNADDGRGEYKKVENYEKKQLNHS